MKIEDLVQDELAQAVEEPNEFRRISSNGESSSTSIAYESHQRMDQPEMVNQNDGLQS